MTINTGLLPIHPIFPMSNGTNLDEDDGRMSEDERIIDIYTRAFVMGMGVRCPTKFRLLSRFNKFCRTKNDGMLPKTEEEIFNLIPDFIEHLGEI